MPFQSTKRFGPITTTHRNWHAEENVNRNSVKCARIHGYSREVEVTFEGELDENGWVYDFGQTKEMKNLLEKYWDHKVLINSDDPKMDILLRAELEGIFDLTIMDTSKGHSAAIEGSAKWVYDEFQNIVDFNTSGRVKIVKVQVWEHPGNSSSYVA